jgi:rhodanese-related sulfurtransferase
MPKFQRVIASPTILTISIAMVLWLLPLALYLFIFGRVPQIQASEALELLGKPGENAVLVDVRPVSAYQQWHIMGSISLPSAQILEFDSSDALTTSLRGKTLLAVCNVGVSSIQAVRHLNSLGVSAYSVRGGIQDWGRAWPQYKDNPFSQLELPGGVIQEPFEMMTRIEQAAAALALLWIKPTYMLLSAIVGVILVRHETTDLRILGWGLLVFLSGEIFCAINYIFLKDNSYFAEYMHSYSMAVAFSLVFYAVLEGLDQRLVHFTQADKSCAMRPVCGPCVKYQQTRCGIHRITQLMGITLILAAIIPLLSPFNTNAYNTQIGPINHYYVRPLIHQWFEARYSPWVAVILIGTALLVMQLTPLVTLHPLTRVFFCAGAGFFGFAIFRVTLGMLYAEALVWATFWEELTELLFVVATIYILWVFRRTLLPDFNLSEKFKFVLQ